MNKLFIKKEILTMDNLTSEGIMVYVALVKMSNNAVGVIGTSIAIIEAMLKNNVSANDRYIRDKIKNGLINLNDNEIIHISHGAKSLKEIKPNDTLLIDASSFNIDTKKEHFTLVSNDEIVNIMNYKEKKIEVDKLLRYFLVVVGTINNNSKVGFTTIEQLSEMAKIHIHTATTKYNQILENLKILYIHRHERTVRSFDGFIHKVSNTYGRYNDKQLILDNVLSFHGELDNYSTENISSDEARGIKIKWNNMVKKLKNGYEPKETEINDLDNKIKQYNRKYHADKTMKLTLISELVGILKC